MVDTGEALPIVDVNDLQKWGNTFTPDYTQMEDDMTIKKSPFPFNDLINSKIVYWTGDVSLLNAHAIVCCNNETFTEKNDLVTIKTLNRAGKELKQELINEIRVCKTGDAKITKGAIHKERPHKSTIFYPLPPPLSAFVHFWHTPPPYRTSAMPFHFKEISLKLLLSLNIILVN